MHNSPLFIGLDLGTSGARAIAMGQSGDVVGKSAFQMTDFGENHRDPAIWQAVSNAALKSVLVQIDSSRVAAICVDGTSGTLLATDKNGTPVSMGRMYNDPCSDQGILENITRYGPQESAAHGATSGLAKALVFQQKYAPDRIMHQADWISGNLCGTYVTDENNALKTGYDPVTKCWPDWIGQTGMDVARLPQVLEPGTPYAQISPTVAADLGLQKTVQIISGTTDGCASFVATGAENIGDGVTVLGTSLTLKILSDKPVFAPKYGIYSHHILGKWLVGGSSNTGGRVLLQHFSTKEIAVLSNQIDPKTDSGLNYYPLPKIGERFPVSDPDMAPRMQPVPKNRADFLKAIFEGIAAIEISAYKRLTELNAPKLRSLRTIGGGAENQIWTCIRQRYLDLEITTSQHSQAAYGAAYLSRFAMM